LWYEIIIIIVVVVGRSSTVGVAILYGLDGPVIESSIQYHAYCVYFSGAKRPGRGVDHQPPSSAEVKERVQLYIYPSLGLHGLL
jgi:hypothetical protein